MHHAPGELVGGRYEIVSLLSRGDMGALYRAEDRQQGRFVALKRMADVADPRFEEQGRFLSQLRHPAIPQVLDYFTDGGVPYMAFEFIEGDTLEKVTRDCLRLSQDRAIDYAVQVCEILDYLHSQNPPIIHRDLQPSNLILRRDTDQIALVDFGLARDVANAATTKTQVGTLGYAPVEQLEGKPEPASDVYSLGATMFYMLTGQTPQAFQIPPLLEVQPDLDVELAVVVDKSVRQRMELRYQSAMQMRADLMAVRAQLEHPAQPPTPTPPQAVETAAPPPTRWATGVAALLLIALIAWHGRPSPSAPAPPPKASATPAPSVEASVSPSATETDVAVVPSPSEALSEAPAEPTPQPTRPQPSPTPTIAVPETMSLAVSTPTPEPTVPELATPASAPETTPPPVVRPAAAILRGSVSGVKLVRRDFEVRPLGSVTVTLWSMITGKSATTVTNGRGTFALTKVEPRADYIVVAVYSAAPEPVFDPLADHLTLGGKEFPVASKQVDLSLSWHQTLDLSRPGGYEVRLDPTTADASYSEAVAPPFGVVSPGTLVQ